MADISKNIGFFQAGDTFCLSLDGDLIVKNNGPGIAENVQVVIDIPDGIQMAPEQSSVEVGSFDEGTLTWLVGSLLAGEGVTGSFCFEVTDDCEHPYDIEFEITSDECECTLFNNRVCFEVFGGSCCDFQNCTPEVAFDCAMLDGCTITVGSLSDVDTTGIADTNILQWNAAAGEWQPAEMPLPFDCDDLDGCDISHLGNVNVSGASDGFIMFYNAAAGEWQSREDTLSTITPLSDGNYEHSDGEGTLETIGYNIVVSGDDDGMVELRSHQNAMTSRVDICNVIENCVLDTATISSISPNPDGSYTHDNEQVTSNLGYILGVSGTVVFLRNLQGSTSSSVDICDVDCGVELDDLTDVDVSGSVSGDVLQYDGSEWVAAGTVAFDCSDLDSCGIDSLSDVDTTTAAPVINQVLLFDGVNWVPGENPGFQCEDLDGCTVGQMVDVNLSGISTGQVLKWDGSEFLAGEDEDTIFSCLDLNGCPLDAHLDVQVSGATADQILRFDGVDWVADDEVVFSCSDLNACSIDGLSDVDTTGATIGQVLKYDGAVWAADDDTSVIFECSDLNGCGVEELSNIDITGISTGGVLKWDGSGFVAGTDEDTIFDCSDLGGCGIDGLSDVDTTTAAPGSDQVLTWNGSEWVPGDNPDTVFACGDLAGCPVGALSDVDTTTATPNVGDILEWDGSNWVPAQQAGGSDMGAYIGTRSGSQSGYGNGTLPVSSWITDYIDATHFSTDNTELTVLQDGLLEVYFGIGYSENYLDTHLELDDGGGWSMLRGSRVFSERNIGGADAIGNSMAMVAVSNGDKVRVVVGSGSTDSASVLEDGSHFMAKLWPS